ncbi:hypothetical protein F2Q68_00033557 [Brassica cretica]|uniref:Uncharacterized protein n=1 Tax=Brassica cretica TaxID=69181 RepID=A0A8S9H2T6_BRACR|nr:hypothetical protein F2Q68_00033557 [Brassica cretica]
MRAVGEIPSSKTLRRTHYILAPRSVYAFPLLPLSRHSIKMEIFHFFRSSTELWLELGRYVATELWLELGRYVATELLARARSLRIDRAEHVFGCCVATLFELLSDD